MIHTICKKYGGLLMIGRTYTAREFSRIIHPHNKAYAIFLEKTTLIFTPTKKGMILETK
ncbi:hypothetical protein LJC53_04860 [Bacteroidales bacterium OttesenSCG-928-C03]|nr:hypothetical protein [Bacteroidales bacterium OttesenSCG-928-C03]MDL2326133.1 hypothetical protein [Bacteroidales bacterium OttesenSCG-928-A14]